MSWYFRKSFLYVVLYVVRWLKNAFLDCYNGYFLANRDAPSRCTATDCLVAYMQLSATASSLLTFTFREHNLYSHLSPIPPLLHRSTTQLCPIGEFPPPPPRTHTFTCYAVLPTHLPSSHHFHEQAPADRVFGPGVISGSHRCSIGLVEVFSIA